MPYGKERSVFLLLSLGYVGLHPVGSRPVWQLCLEFPAWTLEKNNILANYMFHEQKKKKQKKSFASI